MVKTTEYRYILRHYIHYVIPDVTGVLKRQVGGHLVGYRFVFEAGFIQQQLQLSAVEVGDSQRLNKSGVFASL